MKFGTFSLCLIFASFTLEAIEITTEHNSKSEIATAELLTALRQAHDLEKWEVINKVHIDKKAIPHSHPILTLHTRHTNKEGKDELLSTYLHEQIHWHLDNRFDHVKAAIDELKTIFKQVPVGYPIGAQDEFSTYLHLIVCYLERESVSELLSQTRLEKLEEFWLEDHYTWIYQQVLEQHEQIKQIVEKHKLQII